MGDAREDLGKILPTYAATADDAELHIRFFTVAIIGIRLAVERGQIPATAGLCDAVKDAWFDVRKLRDQVEDCPK